MARLDTTGLDEVIQDMERMGLKEGDRYAGVVEGICHAVGEAADDEKRNRKHERKNVSFTGKCHCSSHEETTRDTEYTANESASPESEFKDVLCCTLDVHRRNS